MLTGSESSAAATVAASTAAAPLMSHFIVSMDFGGLSERPPESKVIPLPTNATVLVASGCVYESRTSRGGRVDPMPTPIRPPYPPAASAPSSSTSKVTPTAPAACTATSARAAGGRSSGEVLTRSRTRLTALAITSPRRTAAASSVSTVTATDTAGVARYFRKVYAPSSAPVVTASASAAVRAGRATATDLTPSSRTDPVFAATDRSAVPAARRRFSTSKVGSASSPGLPSPTARISVAGSLPPPGILVSSSSSPVAPRAASVSARVPPSASSTPSAPGATLGPSGVCATPMTRTSASAVPAADSLLERETVTLPILLPPAAPACYPEPRRDPPHSASCGGTTPLRPPRMGGAGPPYPRRGGGPKGGHPPPGGRGGA